VVAAGQLGRLRAVGRVVSANPEMRRVQFAFATFNSAEWSVWIAMLVYAYDLGGATAAGLVAVAQLAPATAFAPFASVLADRRPPARVLTLGYLLQSAAMVATGAVLLADGPAVLVIVGAATAATLVTMTRPTQAVLIPALAHKPEELTAANVFAGWNESVSILLAPALAGVLLALEGPGTVFVVMGLLLLAGAFAVARVQGPPPALATASSEAGLFAESAEGFRVIAREPEARTLVALIAAEFISLGLLDVLYVVLALGILDMGDGGAGFLNAASGLGGVLAVVVTASLVGRARLLPAMLASLAVWAGAFVVLTIWPTVGTAVVLLALAGGARVLFDVSGRTLLQRTAPPHVLARVFGVLEGVSSAGLAIGSLIAPLAVAIGGDRAVILATGLLLPVLALSFGRRLVTLDAAARVPVVQISLLRSLRIFALLPPPELEGLARSVEPVHVEAGETVITQGDEGDRYYAIAEGEVEVLVDGVEVARRGRGEGFGEIALLRQCPRMATVRAVTPVELYALEGERFLEVVTGHSGVWRAATAVMEEADASASAHGGLEDAQAVGADGDDVAGLDPALAVEGTELEETSAGQGP
jgi:MFS family permease